MLPERDSTAGIFRAVAHKVNEFGGRATLVGGARLDPEREEEIVAEVTAARREEYQEIAREARRFLTHARRERDHRVLSEMELSDLEADLGKLRSWLEQVRARDHFGAEVSDAVAASLAEGDDLLAEAIDEAFGRAPESRP